MQSVAFLFLDESIHEALDLAALTGVLVPAEVYVEVRDAFCKLVWDILDPPENTIPAPIELHARELLPELEGRTEGEQDRSRLEVFSRAAAIVNNYGLKVFRVAYLNRREIATLMRGDPKLYGLNFFGIERLLQETLRSTLVLPVMDGVPSCVPEARPPVIDPQLIRAFAQHVRFTHHMRMYEATARSISIENYANLAEPVFADSEHSTLLQLADIVSYLLLQLDRAELEEAVGRSDFKEEVLRRAKDLNGELLHLWRGLMKAHKRAT